MNPTPTYINLADYKNIQWQPSSREARLLVATGVKGVGKSYQTIMMLLEEYVKGDIPNGIMPRKVLILDVNNEYGEFGIETLYPEDIPIFNVHPIVEARRIVPFAFENGKARKMNNSEIVKLLEYTLDKFKGGCLLIEDPNKYQATKMNDDVIGALCTNRHYDCDIVLHYQSASRPLPAIWVNANVVRFHHQQDDIFRSEMKLVEKTEMFKITQILVDTKYYADNKRFYVWINIDENKLIGDFTEEEFKDACQEYISLNPSAYKPFTNRIDNSGRKQYTPEQAIMQCKEHLLKKYWGNHLN